jgi:AAA15 family ATPase/GTPase
MLNSLYIKNYRNLKELQIDSVAQVNLITGKNNTGKSSVLEALAIYASKGDLSYIFQLLENRGEYFKPIDSNYAMDSNIRSLSSLFTDRIVKLEFNNPDLITVKGNENSLTFGFSVWRELNETLSKIEDRDGEITFDVTIVTFSSKEKPVRMSYNLERAYFDQSKYGKFKEPNKFQFIKTVNIDQEINEKLFDTIALTEKESYVIDALKIIEPKTERIAFVKEEKSQLRTAVIKLSDTSEVLPLKSMGDGINHILTIILAAVNCENGYLLIDEFENWLHHTVQEQLWKIIFKLAQDLNIQVFATTHSEDCVRGFSKVLNNLDNTVTGQYIRLENKNGEIKVVDYSPEELEIANQHNIETR